MSFNPELQHYWVSLSYCEVINNLKVSMTSNHNGLFIARFMLAGLWFFPRSLLLCGSRLKDSLSGICHSSDRRKIAEAKVMSPKVSPKMRQAFCPLTAHWPKQITWPSPMSTRWEVCISHRTTPPVTQQCPGNPPRGSEQCNPVVDHQVYLFLNQTFLEKIKSYYSVIPLLRYIPKRIVEHYSSKNMYANVHSSTIHGS